MSILLEPGQPPPGRPFASRVLMCWFKWSPGLIFLGFLVGVVLLGIGIFWKDTIPRNDEFVILPSPGKSDVLRLELPEDWTVAYRTSRASQTYADLKMASREVELTVSWGNARFYDRTRRTTRPYHSPAEFLEEQPGGAGEMRPGRTGNIAVVRQSRASAPRPGAVSSPRHNTARVELILFSRNRDLEVRFSAKSKHRAELEELAFRLFEEASVLPRTDAGAQNLIVVESEKSWKEDMFLLGCLVAGGSLGLFFLGVWGALYLNVVEGTQGLPALKPLPPTYRPEGKAATDLDLLVDGPNGLAKVGFEPDGWFFLDDVDETHVWAWQHPEHPAIAYVLYFPLMGCFRFRIARRFDDGTILVTTTRWTDISCPPPARMDVQMLPTSSAAELWTWHLDAEPLLRFRAKAAQPTDTHIQTPDSRVRVPSLRLERDSPVGEGRRSVVELWIEMAIRWGRHHRRGWFWVFQFSPLRELRRLWGLRGVSLAQQIERGWTTPPRLREHVQLAPDDWE